MDRVTEKLHECAIDLDEQPPLIIAKLLVDNQTAAADAATNALPALTQGAEALANRISQGGTLYYAAAGSSGLMAVADAAELGGTFGIDSSKIQILMAGGIPKDANMPGDTEDETLALATTFSDSNHKDCLIAISASGSTPYTMEAAHLAKQAGCYVIGIANNADTPLLNLSDCAVYLPTPAEVISGSTRMGAATAQKIALNTLSTLMAIHLGHVHDGMMVNMKADNIKLRQRASDIVQTIAKASREDADHALDQSDGNIKAAILLCAGCENFETAKTLLKQSDDHLRKALKALQAKQ